MPKNSARRSVSDSELGSEASGQRVSRLSAVLCPAVCALIVVCVFAASFVGARLAYDRYDAFCVSRRFDVGKLYIFPNLTITTRD